MMTAKVIKKKKTSICKPLKENVTGAILNK